MKGTDHVASKLPRDFSRHDPKEPEQLVENYHRQGDVYGDDFAALLRAREANEPIARSRTSTSRSIF